MKLHAGANILVSIFGGGNWSKLFQDAREGTGEGAWCIWCIKINVSGLLKNENKKKKSGWFERINLFVLCWIGRSFFVSLSNQKHCYGELCMRFAVFFI